MDVWFGMLIEAPVARGQSVTLVGESKRRHSFIAERDVAAFAMAATDHPAARNTTMVVGGPDAVTFQEVVHAYEAVLGRSIPVQRVAPGEPIPGLPEPVWRIAAALETYDSPIPMDDTARTFGMTLTSVNAFASTSRLVSQT
jgi:NADH dehydrogenase